jgi:hypothetical protein
MAREALMAQAALLSAISLAVNLSGIGQLTH